MFLLFLLLLAGPLRADEGLQWRTNRNAAVSVTADLHGASLLPVLEEIATSSGWRVFVEPGTRKPVSAKFKNLPPGDALRLLLGDLNFALVPETNGQARLFVFRTSQENATQAVAAKKLPGKINAKPVPNELIVRLKPGANIDELARLLGAKVIGKIDGINAYRLQFSDQASTDFALDRLSNDPDVTDVEQNYALDRPEPSRSAPGSTLGPPSLQLKPPPENGRVIVGLIDTAVQSLGTDLDKFLLKQVSVAGQSVSDPRNPLHGTAMAETILRGLEKMTDGKTAVQILPVDVYGPNPSTSTFDVASGIVQAVNQGAKILNLSLGSDADSPVLRALIADAVSKNIVVFAAKGNEPVTTPVYPAAYDGVLAVTALDQGKVAPYANRADIPSVGGPGTSVVYYNGQSYITSGTSVSTAYVSGLAGGYMDSGSKSTTQAKDFIQSQLTVKP